MFDLISGQVSYDWTSFLLSVSSVHGFKQNIFFISRSQCRIIVDPFHSHKLWEVCCEQEVKKHFQPKQVLHAGNIQISEENRSRISPRNLLHSLKSETR